MSQYLDHNQTYWDKGYEAPNVESIIFRFYGRILKPELNITGNGAKLLDFGCGQGAAVNYFNALGFDARGVDISGTDVNVARIRYPHIKEKFNVCEPCPSKNKFYGFEEGVSVITAMQSLYFFDDTDFEMCLEKLHKSMKSDGIIFATMMSVKCQLYYENSKPARGGLREVSFTTNRYSLDSYFIRFIEDEDHLLRTFPMFEPIHVGHYSEQLRSDESERHHYTFIGRKKG